ncbi:lipolytic protein G-D-S-L family [Proteus phage PM 75]|uniref:Lipolytic protein G-D-S-L family n=1 Tax=Proteus phage PM 75 TaxID=1560282 RepID=A0A0F6NYD4_9CAUD|nr:lipolytic protein G-D-S-L family [Proteus phage PM 75]AIW03084.1 lipolytic protein G-D-S-L family [Proteus phage PM 75]
MIRSMIPSSLPLLGNPYTLHLSNITNLFLMLLTILCIAVPNPVLGSARVALIGDSLSVGINSSNTDTECIYCKVGVGIDTLIKETVLHYRSVPTKGSIVITVGTNDYYKGYNKEEYLDKLYTLITIVRTYNTDGTIIIVQPNPVRPDVLQGVQSFVGAYNEVQELVPNVKVITPSKADAPDGIHYRSYREYYMGFFKDTLR